MKAAAAVLLVFAAIAAQTAQRDNNRYVPDDLLDASGWLQRFAEQQRKAMAGVSAFHDFQFTDRVAESGITFKHVIVDDAGRTYKAAHYDHGNGMAVADVDGDGRLDIYFTSQVGGNQLWKNVGNGRAAGNGIGFEDITASAGVGVPGKVSVSASFADIDNDGDEDLYVTTVRAGNMLFENDGREQRRFHAMRRPRSHDRAETALRAPVLLGVVFERVEPALHFRRRVEPRDQCAFSFREGQQRRKRRRRINANEAHP